MQENLDATHQELSVLGAEFNAMRLERDELERKLAQLTPDTEALRRDLAIRDRERDALAATAKQTGEAVSALTHRARATRRRRAGAHRRSNAPRPIRARGTRTHRDAGGSAGRIDGARAHPVAPARRGGAQARATRRALARTPRAARRESVITTATSAADERPVCVRRRDRLAAGGAAAHPDGLVRRRDGADPCDRASHRAARSHAVHFGLARADIAAAHPELPAAGTCRLHVALPLPPGRHEIVLVALRDGAPEVELLRRTIDVAFARLMGNVESPGAARVPAGPRARVRLVLPSPGACRARRASDWRRSPRMQRTRIRGPMSRACWASMRRRPRADSTRKSICRRDAIQ